MVVRRPFLETLHCWFVFRAHLQHMEVPRLGVEPELQLPAYATAHVNARSLTHCVRPGVEPTSSWIPVRFVTTEPQWELQPRPVKSKALDSGDLVGAWQLLLLTLQNRSSQEKGTARLGYIWIWGKKKYLQWQKTHHRKLIFQ